MKQRIKDAAIAASLVFGWWVFSRAQNTQPSYSQLIAAPYRNFIGGLNDSGYRDMAGNESPDLINVVLDEVPGAIVPRNGFIQCGKTPSGSSAAALYEYVQVNGTKRLIVGDKTNVWSTQDCISYSTITTNGGGTYIPTFLTVRDKLWVISKATHVVTWDGVTASLLDGRSNTPNPAPPRCSYGAFWRERVWCARTSAQPSSVAWSAITDSGGNDLDPSTGSVSWPATNTIYVDRDGGSPINGIFPYRDGLYVFKENGIWRIQFNNDYDLAVIKTLSTVGTRFGTSIREIDGLLHFVGPDGIYVFDGDQSVRLSDKIRNTLGLLKQNSGGSSFHTWTTVADFSPGTFSSMTAISNANLTITTNPALVDNGNFETGTFSSWKVSTQTATGSGSSVALTTAVVNTGGLSGTYDAVAYGQCGGSPSSDRYRRVYIFSNISGSTLTYSEAVTGCSSTPCTVDLTSYSTQTLRAKFEAFGGTGGGRSGGTSGIWTSTFTGSQLSFLAQEIDSDCNSHGTVFGWAHIDQVQAATFFSSGVYTSDIQNVVSVSSWSTFDVSASENGGALYFQVRVGSNTGAVQQSSFTDIVAGSLIPGNTSQIYIQWRTTATTAGGNWSNAPVVQSVTVNFLTGDQTSQPIHGFGWKNRYWIAASTLATTNDIVLQQTRLPNHFWTKFNLQIGAMSRYNDNFYAASSTGSAIFRMDYGTNDNGAAIGWYWTSRDETWGFPNNKKRLQELDLDFRYGNATSAYVAYACDTTNFTSKSINLSGSNTGNKVIYLNGGPAYACRFRFGSGGLDDTATIFGITGMGRAYENRQ